MNTALFEQVNSLAVATPWLHPLMPGYATYGVAAFALLLLAGWWSARRSADPQSVAVSVAAGIGTLLAVAVNQPIVDTVAERRPYRAVAVRPLARAVAALGDSRLRPVLLAPKPPLSG